MQHDGISHSPSESNPQTHGLSFEAQSRLKKEFPGMIINIPQGGNGIDVVIVEYKNRRIGYQSTYFKTQQRGGDFLEGDIKKDFGATNNTIPYQPNTVANQLRSEIEKGERAADALGILLNQPRAAQIFLTDRNIYQAIADGWMSNLVTPELVLRFKENVIFPIYQSQGWTLIPSSIGIGFNHKDLINGLPAINIYKIGTQEPILMNRGGVNIYLPHRFGFGTLPMRVPQIQQNNNNQSPGLSTDFQHPLNRAEGIQRDVHTMIKENPRDIKYISERWEYADINAKQYYLENFLKPKLLMQPIPKGSDPNIKSETLLLINLSLGNIKTDQRGFILDVPVHINLRSEKWYKDPTGFARILIDHRWNTQFIGKSYDDNIKK